MHPNPVTATSRTAVGKRRLCADVGLVHFTPFGFIRSARRATITSSAASAVPKAAVILNGKTLTIVAENLSDKKHLRPIAGRQRQALEHPLLPHREIKDGGQLVFAMGPEPNKQWGVEAKVPD